MTIQQIKETAAYLNQKGIVQPRAGIVLGTGLNDLVRYIDGQQVIEYREIPGFPSSTIAFHQGRLIFGKISNVPVVVMQGRFHYYEGYSMQQITFPVRVMHELGIQYLLLSNAAGGMNPSFKKGDLIITEDHINLLPDNPLRGLDDSFGNRFTDMSQPYHPFLQEAFEKAFEQNDIPVKKGTYVSVMGPNLETKAEYRWLRSTGADMVGMSTVPEVIVANQLGIQCGSVSVITDECDPDHLKPVNIEEIIAVAGTADLRLSSVFGHVLSNL